jgi:hypothetical protein
MLFPNVVAKRLPNAYDGEQYYRSITPVLHVGLFALACQCSFNPRNVPFFSKRNGEPVNG